MLIFIGGLPSEDYETEVLNLLQDINKKEQTQKRLTIHKHKDSYFCIVNISDEKTAKKFIRKYNLKNPYGQPLTVREFIHRSYGNERRDINWRQVQWQAAEKRRTERRVLRQPLIS